MLVLEDMSELTLGSCVSELKTSPGTHRTGNRPRLGVLRLLYEARVERTLTFQSLEPVGLRRGG